MVGKTIKKWWPIFVVPTLAAFIIGFLWPFIWGIYLSFCKFTTVQDVTFVGFSNYQKILLDNTFSHAFWLTVYIKYSDQSAGNRHCTGADKRIQGNQCIQNSILYAKPDRWYCSWIHLADLIKWSVIQMGTTATGFVCKERIYRYADPSVLAADRIYDDHLCGRSE